MTAEEALEAIKDRRLKVDEVASLGVEEYARFIRMYAERIGEDFEKIAEFAGYYWYYLQLALQQYTPDEIEAALEDEQSRKGK